MAGGHTGSWTALLILGAFHGINPAMGWLFAVALGLQEHRRAAVWRALLPLGLGHALAIAAAILLTMLAGLTIPLHYLRRLVPIALIGMAVPTMVRHSDALCAAIRL